MINTIRKIRRSTILLYGTILLAAGQSLFLHLITTDYAHKIVSNYFIIEILILGVMILFGLRNKWTRIILTILTVCETILFLQEMPISPDTILMIIIWIIRVYAIAGLFTQEMNRYYKTEN